METIRQIQRCYGQRMDEKDIEYYYGLQHILQSVSNQKRKKALIHNPKDRANTFFNYDMEKTTEL